MNIKELCPPAFELVANIRKKIAEEEAAFMHQYDRLRADERSSAEQIERRIQRANTEFFYRVKPLREHLESMVKQLAHIYAMQRPPTIIIPKDGDGRLDPHIRDLQASVEDQTP